jgi:hypothetical protein
LLLEDCEEIEKEIDQPRASIGLKAQVNRTLLVRSHNVALAPAAVQFVSGLSKKQAVELTFFKGRVGNSSRLDTAAVAKELESQVVRGLAQPCCHRSYE